MALVDFVRDVREMLANRGEKILGEQYVNKNRNYVIRSAIRAYLLKWQDEPFGAASKFTRIKGIGVTLDPSGAYDPFRIHFDGLDMRLLFQWTAVSGVVYGINRDSFDLKKESYTQRSGEKVLVIAVSDLERDN